MKRFFLICLICFGITQTAWMQDANCINLSAEDCALYDGAINLNLTSATISEFEILLGSNGEVLEQYSASGVAQFENGVPTLADVQFADYAHIILADERVYLQYADSSDWLVGTNITESFQILQQNLAALNLAAMQRGEDTELNGQAMAVFEGDVDANAFLNNPVFITILAGFQGIDPAFLEESFPLLIELMNPKEIHGTAWIGLEDHQMHYIALHMNIGISIPPLVENTSFSLDTSLYLSDHNQPIEATAPTENLVETEAAFLPLDPSADNFSPQGTLSSGVPIKLTTLPDAEQQYFVYDFTASAGEVINISSRALDPASGLDTMLILMSNQNSELAQNDDHGSDSEILARYDAQISDFEIPVDGTYRVLVMWFVSPEASEFELSLTQE